MALPEAGTHVQPRALDRARAFVRSVSPRRVVAAIHRDVLAPLLLALVPLFWVVDATYRASLATLGRDQGIFQYVAWAVLHGERDYADIRDVNGPLIHLIHVAFLKLGGGDEHTFRTLDLTVTGASFALTGLCLAGLASRDRASRRPSWAARVAWAAAAWVVLSVQYQLHLAWNQAQRESFCDWFLLPSVGLQLLGARRRGGAERARLVAMGALSVLPWFGKPTFVLFTAAQLLSLLVVEPGTLRARARRALEFAGGGALASIVPLAFLFGWGDARAFLRISTSDVPHVYRFIWAKTAREILGDEGALLSAAHGAVASAAVLAFVVAKLLPRRAAVLALLPLAAIGNVIAQHKGFGYHFHPLTAFTLLAWLALVVALWERFRTVGRAKVWGRWLALAAATALAGEVAVSMRHSPHLRDVWILAGGATPARRSGKDYLTHYKTYDFFPFEMRQAAQFLREATPDGARVQTFGMDPYLLFLAERRSATPYIYAYDLDASAALAGGFENRPTQQDAEYILWSRGLHEQDMLARLRARAPEAFVFIDRSPLMALREAEEDFAQWCPETTAWMKERYRKARELGPYHVWLRADLPVPEGRPTTEGEAPP